MTRAAEVEREPVYAWVVLAASSYATFLAVGQVLSYGLIYVELLDVYQEGPIKTTLITIVFSVFVALLGPVFGYLGDRFSTRVFIMAAGLTACAGLLFSSFAPSITVLSVTYGVLMGCSDAAAYANSLGIVNKYFQRNNGLANGIALASGGMGTILLPFLFQYLIETYSVRGLFFVLAGLWLNMCVAGALIRPKTATTSTELKAGAARPVISAEIIYRGIFHPDIMQTSNQSKYDLKMSLRTKKPRVEKTGSDTINISVISINKPGDNQLQATSGNSDNPSPIDQEKLAPVQYQESNDVDFSNMIKSICTLQFWALLLADFFANIGYFSTLMFIPAHIIDNGYNSSTATMCLSLIGGMDIVGKLGFGYLGDRGFLDYSTLLAGCLVTAGAPMCLLAFNHPFTLFLIWCLVLGSFAGMFEVFRGPIMTNIVGKRCAGAGYGAFGLDFGVASAVGQLMFSSIKELTGAYTGAFIASGCCMFLGAVITVLSRICLKTNFRQKYHY